MTPQIGAVIEYIGTTAAASLDDSDAKQVVSRGARGKVTRVDSDGTFRVEFPNGVGRDVQAATRDNYRIVGVE